MYHATSPHIIEGSDITAVHDMAIEQHKNGKKYLHMTAELNPEKNYDIREDARVEHMLHVTDGVTPRLLSQQHAYPKKGALPLPNFGGAVSMDLKEAQETLDIPPDVTVKGHKVRK